MRATSPAGTCHGRYIWRHGHEYIGTWRAGDKHADGGMYIGTWCEEAGAVHADGVYYPPSGGLAVPMPREPCDPITSLLQELEV